MINITIRQISKNGFDDLGKWFNNVVENLPLKVHEIGDSTLDFMRDYIEAKKVRPGIAHTSYTASLSQAIGIDKYANGFGIGRVEELEKEAPHFLAINYGSDHIVGMKIPGEFINTGAPDPNSDRKEAFLYGRGSYMMIPKQGIQAINYIEKSAFFLNQELNKLAQIFSEK